MAQTLVRNLDSPFGAALEPYGADLPPAFRDQFLTAPEAPYSVVVGGRMDRICHRPAALWPVFWLLSKGEIFFPEMGSGIPAALTIESTRDSSGAPVQTWERTFRFPNGPVRKYRSTMHIDPGTGLLAERQGPGDRLEELATIRYTPRSTIEFETVHSTIRLGRKAFRLPRRFWITAYLTEYADRRRDDSIFVSLLISHPVFGSIFGYEGSFKVGRRPVRSTNGELFPSSA